VTASWVEKVKEVLGITAVSQVWAEKPAWYFWISEAPGVYHLQMENASAAGDFTRGVFSIKCYPFPHGEIFHAFSGEEQELIQSDLFDHTNTPRLENLSIIPESFFNVGIMEYGISSDEDMAFFTFETLNAMRIRYEHETVQEYLVIKKSKRIAKGDIGRDVPGWAVGYLFFDRVLSLYSNYSKRKPGRVIMTRSPGFEHVYTETDGFQCLDSKQVKINALTVLFLSDHGTIDTRGDRLIREHIVARQQDVVYDRTFRCGHFHHDHDQIPSMPPLNELWWTLPDADYRSELAPACGCE
jgi:hypothetical protein